MIWLIFRICSPSGSTTYSLNAHRKNSSLISNHKTKHDSDFGRRVTCVAMSRPFEANLQDKEASETIILDIVRRKGIHRALCFSIIIKVNRGVSNYAERGLRKSEKCDQVGQQIKRVCNQETRFSSVEESTSLASAISKLRQSLLKLIAFFGWKCCQTKVLPRKTRKTRGFEGVHIGEDSEPSQYRENDDNDNKEEEEDDYRPGGDDYGEEDDGGIDCMVCCGILCKHRYFKISVLDQQCRYKWLWKHNIVQQLHHTHLHDSWAV